MKAHILLLLTISATAAAAQQTGGGGVPGQSGGSGASIPATINVLKGTGTAGSAAAATAGTDYLQPSLTTTQTLSGPLNTVATTNTANGAASLPAVNVTGAPFTGGTATTTFPLFYLSCSGSTGVTTFSTSGTLLGINACSGFAGHFINFFANGGSTRFRVDSAGDLFAAGTTTLASTLGVNGDTVFSAGPRAFLSAGTGTLSAITSAAQYGAFKVVKAGTLENIEGTAGVFSCTTNPTFTLEDCGVSAGTCASPTALANVTLTAANTLTDGTITSATLTAGHYLAWETTAGVCTSVGLSASAEYRLN